MMPNFAMDAQHFINKFSGACVNKKKTSIRIQTGYGNNGRTTTISWDYFELSNEVIITAAPRGLAKQYKGAKVLNLEKLPPMRSNFDGSEI
jgi:hypothetical protein